MELRFESQCVHESCEFMPGNPGTSISATDSVSKLHLCLCIASGRCMWRVEANLHAQNRSNLHASAEFTPMGVPGTHLI
jgi:hypothetical protein